MKQEELDNAFKYHMPRGNQAERYEALRANAKAMAEGIQEMCPESREKSLAITKLRESVMWANASIAVNEAKGG